ncbi:MAG: TonB-dependent receptor [Candidatus Pelagibacterales bacterium]
MLKLITTKSIILLILINFLSAASADNEDSIWITPSSTDYSRLATGLAGSNISIITSEEIIKSKHKTIPELLSTYSGIQIRKSYSNVEAVSTSLDMRGFGESSTNNVMILLNGRRLNDIDMGGVNFSAIPHETIERIEIIRGGGASTIYGDGAVGGAINIITKDANDTESDVSVSSSSHETFKTSFITPLKINQRSDVVLSGSLMQSDTYRARGDFNNENLLIRFNHKNDNYKINFDIIDSSTNQLLPGARSIANLDSAQKAFDVSCNLLSDSRTAVRGGSGFSGPDCWDQKDDYSNSDVRSFSGRVDYDLSDDTKIISSISNRDKEQIGYFVAITSTLAGSTGDTYSVTNVDTDYFSQRIVNDSFVSDNLVRFTLGFDIQETDYKNAISQGETFTFGNFINASQDMRALYTQNSINIMGSSSILSFGLRVEKADYSVSETYDNAVAKFASKTARSYYQTSMSNEARNIGIEHILNKNTSLSYKYATAFRTPDLDARNLTRTVANGGDGDFILNDQTSEEHEIGINYQNQKLNLNASYYEMDSENEIRYLAPIKNNHNVDPIKREGIDIDFNYIANNDLDVRGSFSYIDAKYKSGLLTMGSFKGTYAADSVSGGSKLDPARVTSEGLYNIAGLKVPLIAEYNYNIGLDYKLQQNIDMSIDMSFVDDRFVSGDEENIEPVIPSYYLFDIKFSSNMKKHKWSLGVNNIFNTSYYDFAISSSSHGCFVTPWPSGPEACTYGRQSVYPLQRRNLTLDYSYKF